MRKGPLVLVGGILTVMLLVLSGCETQSSSGKSITIVGSTALQPLVEAAGEQYGTENVGVFVNVQGGGSGTGLSQVQEKAVSIGNSDVFAEEKKGIDASKLVDHQVGVVGITPVVNKDVGVKNVSKKQLIAIFTGKLTNWKQLGGEDLPIVLLNRATGSGTRLTFEKWGLDGQQSKDAQEQDSTGMVRQIVGSTPGAISYMAFSYVDKTVDSLSVDNVKPTESNVASNKWKIWSYEHMYTNGAPTGLTKQFLDYMTSDKIQKQVVNKLGYIPTTQMEVKRSVDGKITAIKKGM
ncbi:phosphate ABC transporter substrate-binding protein PstS family protein [Dellaglioa algida]|nr:phosphate ABC transporter substrate-binding protein PstS family protein [Dellaglioa algida]MDK1725942.1 phosphate ABC transporter substrate-binding protein PstS family protein [Dellaglioa algida]